MRVILRLPLLAIALLVPAFGGGDGGPADGVPLAVDQRVFDSDRGGNHEICQMKTDGSGLAEPTPGATTHSEHPSN